MIGGVLRRRLARVAKLYTDDARDGQRSVRTGYGGFCSEAVSVGVVGGLCRRPAGVYSGSPRAARWHAALNCSTCCRRQEQLKVYVKAGGKEGRETVVGP